MLVREDGRLRREQDVHIDQGRKLVEDSRLRYLFIVDE